jgi:nickel-dependent lactate racemase
MIKLLQQKGDLDARLPARWAVQQTIFKEGRSSEASASELMIKALAHPIGSPRLEDLLKPGCTVAIVIDDLTRSTPVRDLLPGLLEVIESRGVPKENVNIVIGNGTHRPMNDKEIEGRVGPVVARNYRIQNHDARSPELVTMGELQGYGKISFNRTVARAGVKIILGSILPHVHNGFGGGPKNVMPGICDFNTIRQHHLKNVLHPKARVGIIEGNPFLQDTRAIARLAGIDFAIQCVYDAFGRVWEVLAGDLFAVHETGIEEEARDLGVMVSGKTDATIVSAYPYDEGVQVMKALMPSAMVTNPKGSIFMVTELTQPLPDFFLDNARRLGGDDHCTFEANATEKLNRCEPLIEGAAMDFNMAIILVLAVARRYNLVLVGHEVLKDVAKALGCKYAPDLAAALRAESKKRKEASVSVIPAGGYVFPIISEPYYLLEEG